MKLEAVTGARGLPLGLAVAAANVPEQAPLVPALGDVPVAVPAGTPVIADKGHDSDPLRDDVEAEGFVPVLPHRTNRVKPSRTDGRPPAAAVQAAVDGRADERLAAPLPRAGRPLVPLLVPVRRPRVPGLHPHGVAEVLIPSLGQARAGARQHPEGNEERLHQVVLRNVLDSGEGICEENEAEALTVVTAAGREAVPRYGRG
jgi:hypothetical protein